MRHIGSLLFLLSVKVFSYKEVQALDANNNGETRELELDGTIGYRVLNSSILWTLDNHIDISVYANRPKIPYEEQHYTQLDTVPENLKRGEARISHLKNKLHLFFSPKPIHMLNEVQLECRIGHGSSLILVDEL